jgi:hypothetical protein
MTEVRCCCFRLDARRKDVALICLGLAPVLDSMPLIEILANAVNRVRVMCDAKPYISWCYVEIYLEIKG